MTDIPIPQTTPEEAAAQLGRERRKRAATWLRRGLILLTGLSVGRVVFEAGDTGDLMGVAALVLWSWSSTHA